jgi:hypothetical protein
MLTVDGRVTRVVVFLFPNLCLLLPDKFAQAFIGVPGLLRAICCAALKSQVKT